MFESGVINLQYCTVGPIGSVVASVAIVDLKTHTDQRSRQHPDPETHGPAGLNARPIIAFYDQTQDAVGGGGSKL